MAVPNWTVAKNAPTTDDPNGTNFSASVDQLLATHGITPIYVGNRILEPGGTDISNVYLTNSNTTDISQPFTMPGGKTSISRVVVPLNPVGAGADLLVELYADGAGVPVTSNLLAATTVSKEVITSFGAPNGIESGGPLAQTPRNNALVPTGGMQILPWPAPANSFSGATGGNMTAVSGEYIVIAGGLDTGAPAVQQASKLVTTVQHLGGGQVSLPQAQEPLPLGTYFGTLIATDSYLVVAGGFISDPSGTNTDNVWLANWDPSTGTVGTWTLQAPLPAAQQVGIGAFWGDRVYVICGEDFGFGALHTVYSASTSGGQITAWREEKSYPLNMSGGFAQAINGWMVVAGGTDTGRVNYYNQTYYARIDSTDGSLGVWQRGPDLPEGISVAVLSIGNDCNAQADSTFMIFGGLTSTTPSPYLKTLTVTAEGVGDYWNRTSTFHFANIPMGLFPNGDGSYILAGVSISTNQSIISELIPATTISVPLPATGLTAGNKYHIVLRQRSTSSSSDYLQYVTNIGAYPDNALSSNRYQNSWSSIGTSLPLVFSDNLNATGANIIHTWEDPASTGSGYTSNEGALIRYLSYNGYGFPTSETEVVKLPNNCITLNPTFTTGVANWNTINCTFVQSNAQTHGGFPFSGLMTPDGVGTTPRVTALPQPIMATDPQYANGQWFMANGWLYSPTGYSQVSLSITWYNRSKVFQSFSHRIVSIPAATWTNFVTIAQAPANAEYAGIGAIEFNTPTSANTLFCSNLTLVMAPGSVDLMTSANQITYDSSAVRVPTGVVQII